MPCSEPQAKIKGLPKHAQDIWVSAFNAALKEYDDDGRANKVAYAAVKKAGYEQDEKGEWHKSNAILDLWESVKRLFAPHIAEQEAEYIIARSFTVTRDTSGSPRWLMIAASAVINKVGAIDSTSLFDSFIRQAPQEGYPILDFIHQGKRVSFGVADWLARDGALYLASGTFDNTELARAASDGLEREPDYWGASISYKPTDPPLVLKSEGEIPVYMAGVNDFISIVPKRMAANLFTATSVTKGVNRTMDEKVYAELVRLVGEERAKMFAGEVDDANRTITATGMVTRSDDTATPPEATAKIAETTTAGTTVEATGAYSTIIGGTSGTAHGTYQHRQDEPPMPETPKVSLDELAAAVSKLSDRITEIEQKMGASSVEESARAKQAEQEIIARISSVEAVKERWETWVNDAPENSGVDAVTISRARTQETTPPTYAEIARATTSKMSNGPHFRRQGG